MDHTLLLDGLVIKWCVDGAYLCMFLESVCVVCEEYLNGFDWVS